MDEARIAALQRMPIFGGIRAEILELLVEQARSLSRSSGEYFFREGDKANSMFVLEGGRVVVLKQWGGHEQPLAYLTEGDCFGEMALMDLFPRSASVRAVEPCRALELRSAAFFLLSQRDLEQFALIQMNLGREVSRRLRRVDERLFRVKMGEPQQADEVDGPLLT